MVETEVHVTGVREMVARLKELDPKLVTKFRKELRDSAKGVASQIQSQIQTTPPLSNMDGYSSRSLIWAGAVTSVAISMTGSRRKDVTPLLKIKVDSPKGMPGYMVGEKAGSRGPNGKTPQGSNLIAVLTERLGKIRGKGRGAQRQIAWRYFWDQRAQLNASALEIVHRYEKIATEEINA
jgi:hypothetical protein